MDNHSRSCPAPLDTPLPTPSHSRYPKFTPPNTPGNEMFAFDEPSSVLASRIMRAQDNPSPPPVSPSRKMTFTNDTKLVDVSEPPTPCYLNAQLPGHVVPLLTTPHSPLLLCNLPSRQSAQPHGDLITFDVEDESTATSKFTPPHRLILPGPSGSRNTGDASEVVKEDSRKETESPLILYSSTEEAEISQSGEPSTLVRRSGRNRRSTTPHRTSPSITSEESHAEINFLIETVPQASNVQTRVKRKSGRAADVVEPQGHQSADKQQPAISGLERDTDASNAGHYSHHRLSSLSPTSSHVLNQLVTTSRDETPPFSKPSISTEFTLTNAMQPVDFQKTPSKESIYTRSPQRLQLDQLSSQAIQVRTPARRILAGEAPPSRSKPFNTLPPTTFSSHTLLSRTPISCIPSGDSLARRATNATNNFEDTLPDKTFSAEPLRIGTPRRQLLDRSPSKNLPPAQFRTPARRIIVEEAPASGSKRSNLFPQTAASSNVLNLGVARNPTFRLNSNDSPARRVIIDDTITADPKHTKHDNTLLHSPIRGMAVRSHSEEPSTTKAIVKSRSSSVEPRPQLERLVFSKLTDLRAPPPKLPFPLIPESIPEEPVNDKRPGASSVLVSVLKQRTSKIPRIGTKPYARPTRSATNKLLDPVRRVGQPKQTPLSPSSSQFIRKNHTPDERTTQETVFAHPTANSFTTGSKRKRPDDATNVSTTLPSTMPDSITQQAARIIDTVDNATPELSNTPTAHDKSDSSQPPFVVGDTREQPSLNALTEEKYLDDRTPVPGPSKMPAPDSQPAETMESNSTKARRTTRTRTRATPATTVTASRSSQSRRRVHNSTMSDTDVFSTMSAVALKALTNSNTVRNQQYIAAKIETEVIRKPGLRPTSPTVKIKTVLQRTQDETSRERRERAQRRAQRNEEVLQNGRVGTEQQPESPTPIVLDLNIDHDTGDSGTYDGHCMGAGDDEDYQSYDPQSKKRKVTHGSGHSEARNGRRVKWDKGLYTEVRLDEIQLGARLLHKHQTMLKGCLAPTSKKAAQLDTMGNLPTTSLSVEDLVEECVVVKKFVYDDDEGPPQPPPPIALGTRSKGKKTKP